MKTILRGLALGLASCLAAARGGEPGARIRVATLNTVLTEVARQVGGARVEVVGIVAPGVDPHSFNPSPSDVRALVDAEIVLASGLNMEAYLDRLVVSVGPRGRVVAVGNELPIVLDLPGSPGRVEKDPHWWHSIGNVILSADLVRREFTRLRPRMPRSLPQTRRATARACGSWRPGSPPRSGGCLPAGGTWSPPTMHLGISPGTTFHGARHQRALDRGRGGREKRCRPD